MTPEEMKAKLEALGINLDAQGQWTQKPNGIDASKFETVQKFIGVAENMKLLLEQQVKKDQATLEALHERLQRVKNGGGR